MVFKVVTIPSYSGGLLAEGTIYLYRLVRLCCYSLWRLLKLISDTSSSWLNSWNFDETTAAESEQMQKIHPMTGLEAYQDGCKRVQQIIAANPSNDNAPEMIEVTPNLLLGLKERYPT